MTHASWLVVLLLAGCPSKKQASERMDDAIGRLNAFADRLCACKTKACADTVQGDMEAWTNEWASSIPTRDMKQTEAQMKRLAKIGAKYSDCFYNPMSSGIDETP